MQRFSETLVRQEAIAIEDLTEDDLCPICLGCGEYYQHSADCNPPLCRRAEGGQGCAGQVALCDCALPARHQKVTEIGPADIFTATVVDDEPL
jgi:hypothetical protein